MFDVRYLRVECGMCESGVFLYGLDAMADHMRMVHAVDPLVWPDGDPAVDLSDIPELLDSK